jgi:hypothetical protein
MQVLDRISLNNIHVIVGGTMTVDVDTVPATIQSVEFDDPDPALVWAETGQKKGTIRGRYLSGGTLTLVNGGQLQISDAASIKDGSTDETLRFQFTLNKAVPTGSKVTFRVDKRDKGQRTIEGNPFDYTVNYTLVAPAIAKAEVKIDLAPLALQPARWTPQVTVGTMQALGATAFAQPPAPKLSAAKKNGTRIVVTGEQIINLASCGKPLTFEIARNRQQVRPSKP